MELRFAVLHCPAFGQWRALTIASRKDMRAVRAGGHGVSFVVVQCAAVSGDGRVGASIGHQTNGFTDASADARELSGTPGVGRWMERPRCGGLQKRPRGNFVAASIALGACHQSYHCGVARRAVVGNSQRCARYNLSFHFADRDIRVIVVGYLKRASPPFPLHQVPSLFVRDPSWPMPQRDWNF